uniref:Uncharacterized protein n=1 Tax=Arundo donax TaxID=35708 RepID=A0A0A8YTX7_ARUDO
MVTFPLSSPVRPQGSHPFFKRVSTR